MEKGNFNKWYERKWENNFISTIFKWSCDIEHNPQFQFTTYFFEYIP